MPSRCIHPVNTRGDQHDNPRFHSAFKQNPLVFVASASRKDAKGRNDEKDDRIVDLRVSFWSFTSFQSFQCDAAVTKDST